MNKNKEKEKEVVKKIKKGQNKKQRVMVEDHLKK